MADEQSLIASDIDNEETQEWLESMEAVLKLEGADRAKFLLRKLQDMVQSEGISLDASLTTPYINTIPKSQEPAYPGDLDIERRIKAIIRWNAMVMVLRANKKSAGIGGHISSFASSATLYEVGHNHFFQGFKGDSRGDQVFFQGHASPGVYSRAYAEGILDEKIMDNFRRELAEGGGLSSYPHPRLMPSFWGFPTVSMGLGPIMSIYLARFKKYLKNRGLKDTTPTRVWAFLGDGEMDEPESIGALALAAREKLDNLTFVVNCNLQRLDGPVRGNSKVIQELEGVFRGAGWNVIKVLWGSNWDPIFERDKNGALARIMNDTIDGEFQKLSISTGRHNREHFFGKDAEALKLVENLSDEQLELLRRGGHDSFKVFAAYHRAVNMNNGRPTVILAKTIKGYGMGESGEGKNIAHQQKKMDQESLKQFVRKFNVPVDINAVEKGELPYVPMDKKSEEYKYIQKRREHLGGFVPTRSEDYPRLSMPEDKTFEPFLKSSGDREISTTMAFVRVISALLKLKDFGKHVVPIIPDEARTFGMEGLFTQYGIYNPSGQQYEPVDASSILPYKESTDGQILQEGINEAGSMSSFIAAGTSYSHQGVPMVPFFSFYSMFGFQRIGDLIWAAADMKVKGFLMGGTAGRTTLNGEGLQHEDGHSHILASTVPSIQTYDPSFLYEMAYIIKDGLKRMYVNNEDCFYYITMYNENHLHPDVPDHVKDIEEGITKGMYNFKRSKAKNKAKINLISSGIIFQQALKAAEILEKDYGVSVDLWSAPSFKRLREDAQKAEAWNRLHPESKPRVSYLEKLLEKEEGPFLAVTDYMRSLPDMIRQWVPAQYTVLGTDGFGMSSSREELRRHFEVDTESIVVAALHSLAQTGSIEKKVVSSAIKKLGIDPEKRQSLHIAEAKEA